VVYNTTTQSVVVAHIFQNILFSSEGESAGFSFTAGTSSITIPSSGIYQVSAGINAETISGAPQSVSVRLTRNGVEIAGSQTSEFSVSNNESIVVPITTTLISAAAGDVIALQFTGSSNNVGLVAQGDGETPTDARLTIVRIA
jgi:hypothetical protein